MKKVCLVLALASGFVVSVTTGLIGFISRPKRRVSFLLAGLVAGSSAQAAIVAENFSANPLQNGWLIAGDTNLFQWDSTNQILNVAWDSSQSNSYFYHPLGISLTRNDDFTLSFDWQLTDAEAGGFGCELGIGLLNLNEATNAGFDRSTGANSPDLVEFDFFPDAGYGPTTWPSFADNTGLVSFNTASDYAIYGPTLGDWYHVVMTYTAANQTMVTTMTNFEQTSGIVLYDMPDATFTDFSVDTVSINSYQGDAYGDSILAHGAVDNIIVTVPPIRHLTGGLAAGNWQMQFLCQSDWNYTLQRTRDFQSWTNVSALTPGNSSSLILQDTNRPADKAFYRVQAIHP